MLQNKNAPIGQPHQIMRIPYVEISYIASIIHKKRLDTSFMYRLYASHYTTKKDNTKLFEVILHLHKKLLGVSIVQLNKNITKNEKVILYSPKNVCLSYIVGSSGQIFNFSISWQINCA